MDYEELTNEQLDIACAEACEWTEVFKNEVFDNKTTGLPPNYTGKPAGTVMRVAIPAYSTDYAAAHTLLDKLREEGWDCGTVNWGGELSGRLLVNVWKHPLWLKTCIQAAAPSFCRAVAICFLKTREEGK